MPKNILFVDHAAAVGGAEAFLLSLGKHLNQERWQLHLACPEGTLAEDAKNHFIVHPVTLPRLRRSPFFLFNWFASAMTLARLARENKAEVIYGNTVRGSIYAALAARITGLPFIWHMQDFWLSENRPRFVRVDRLGKQLLLKTASRVIANSRATAAQLPRSTKVRIHYYGIDVETFVPTMDKATFCKQQNIPPNVPILGMVGRLRPWKGQARFIRAMQHVSSVLPDARFLIVGGDIFDVPDQYEQSLKRMPGELGLSERVIFTGHLGDVRPAMAAMDVFVHPGDPEPFGLVNIEAMAMGKPVVAFGHGALPEIVVNGETGWLVPPGDEYALAEATLTLLRDPARSTKMGQAGRKRVEEKFTIYRKVVEMDKLLARVVE